ncbi:MAG: sugar transferase, partial [Planctomycetota bacterium]
MQACKEVIDKQTPNMQTSMSEWALSQPILDAIVPTTEEYVPLHWRERLYLHTKRAIDIILSFILLIAALPVIIPAAIAIKCTSRGPIIFRQKRAGFNGKPFVMYKFRSMYDGAENDRLELNDYNHMNDGPCYKARNDPRLTPIGRFLRRTSVDELPQLYNVLKGEMSLV